MVFLSVMMMHSLIVTGCQDNIILPAPETPDFSEIDGDCIAFKIKLDKDISSRGALDYDFGSFNSEIEKYENYIDTQDKFRVFFFT